MSEYKTLYRIKLDAFCPEWDRILMTGSRSVHTEKLTTIGDVVVASCRFLGQLVHYSVFYVLIYSMLKIQ